MEKRRLGRSDLTVAPLCLGGNVFGWTADEEMSFRLLDGFVDAGFNFIDTADVYSKWAPGHHGGESETIIGDWLKRRGKRDDVVIATKVGSEMGPRKKGLQGLYRTGGGGVAASARHRLYRSLSVAPRRSGYADRGNTGSLWRPHQGRQGACHRRVQLRA